VLRIDTRLAPVRPVVLFASRVKWSHYTPWWRFGGRGGIAPVPFLTSALEGGEWSASRPGPALPPVPTVQEAGWAPEPGWTQRVEEKSSAPVGDRTPAVRSFVRHCTDCLTRFTCCVYTVKNNQRSCSCSGKNVVCFCFVVRESWCCAALTSGRAATCSSLCVQRVFLFLFSHPH
jgi:hypothetical protein